MSFVLFIHYFSGNALKAPMTSEPFIGYGAIDRQDAFAKRLIDG